MRPRGARCCELRRELAHAVLGEEEARRGDLLLGVLVAVGEPRQAADSHHDHGVTGTERHAGRSLGDCHSDPEPRAHRVDGGLVARVAAGLDALRDPLLDLLDGERAAVDGAVPVEHGIRESETEIHLHAILLFLARGS